MSEATGSNEAAALIPPGAPPPPPELLAEAAPVARLAPRELLLGWCMWLIGTWAVLLTTLGMGGRPFRWMILAAVLGMLGVWPAVRLAERGIDNAEAQRLWRARMQRRRREPAPGIAPGAGEPPVLEARWVGVRLAVFLDWLMLIGVFQFVLWPMWFAAEWSVTQALLLNGAVAAWSLLTALLVAWGCSSARPLTRVLAMLLCIGLVLAEPVLVLIGRYFDASPTPPQDWPLLRFSPLQALWSLTSPPWQFGAGPWPAQIGAVAAAAVLGWVVLFAIPWRPAFRRA